MVDYRSIYWLTVGRLSVNCRPIVSRLLTNSWPIYRSIVSCVDFLRRWLNYILWIWNLKDLSLKPSQPIHCKSSCHLVALFDLSCAPPFGGQYSYSCHPMWNFSNQKKEFIQESAVDIFYILPLGHCGNTSWFGVSTWCSWFSLQIHPYCKYV